MDIGVGKLFTSTVVGKPAHFEYSRISYYTTGNLFHICQEYGHIYYFIPATSACFQHRFTLAKQNDILFYIVLYDISFSIYFKPGMELSFGYVGDADRNKRFPALLAWGYALVLRCMPVLIMLALCAVSAFEILTEVRQNIKAIPVNSFFSVFNLLSGITCVASL